MRVLIFFTLVLLLSINIIQPKKYLAEIDEESKEVENKVDDADNDEVETSTKKSVKSKIKYVMQGNSKLI